jgi:hypothetical protein
MCETSGYGIEPRDATSRSLRGREFTRLSRYRDIESAEVEMHQAQIGSSGQTPISALRQEPIPLTVSEFSVLIRVQKDIMSE